MRIFISYSHRNVDWVHNRLQPVLEAAGVQPIVDRDRFVGGPPVIGQMDGAQDDADKSLLVLTPEYLASDFCRHEMDRALAKNQTMNDSHAVPLVRTDILLPQAIEPLLRVDLTNENNEDAWNLLMRACNGRLAVSPPAWLEARDRVLRHVKDGQSVNLVTAKDAGRAWRSLVKHLQDCLPNLGRLDLMSGASTTRHGFVRVFLDACQASRNVPDRPNDLLALHQAINKKVVAPIVALTHFEIAQGRPSEFDDDLFFAIRHLIEERKLTLLIQSKEKQFAELLPSGHQLSFIDIRTVQMFTTRAGL